MIDKVEIIAYPYDGTRASLAAGTTIVDFEHGTVKTPTGAITKLSTNLGKMRVGFLQSVAVNGDKDIVIQLDTDNKIPVRANTWGIVTHQQFRKLKITTTETTTIYAIGCTDPDAVVDMVGEVTISLGKVTRNSIVSDKDVNFTTALAQGEVETENLSGLTENKIMITGISIQADQALDFYLLFFGSDVFVGAGFDLTHFIGFEQIDLSAMAFQIGAAGTYYYSIEALAVEYEDADESNELHVALLNMDATGKNAGATGEVVLRFMYTPRM